MISICPIIGQIYALYILANRDTYLKSPNSGKKIMAKGTLWLASYIIGYLLYLLIKYYISSLTWLIENRKTEGRYNILTNIGLSFMSFGINIVVIVFELYGKLWRYGRENFDSSNVRTKINAHIAIFFATFGLSILYELYSLYKWMIESSWNLYKEIWPIGFILLTILTFGLFAIYRFGANWMNAIEKSYAWKNSEDKYTKFFGILCLSLLTLGIYPVGKALKEYYKFWKYGIENINNEEEAIKARLTLLAVSLGTYSIVQVWFWYIDGWKYGLEKRDAEDFKNRLKGHLMILVLSFFTYIIYLIGWLYYEAWKFAIDNYESEDIGNWIGSRYVLLIVSFGLYIVWAVGEIWTKILLWSHKTFQEGQYYEKVFGFLILTLFSFGIWTIWFIFKKWIYAIDNCWKNVKMDTKESSAKQFFSHIALCILTCIVPYLLFQIFYQIYTISVYLSYPYDSELYNWAWTKIYIMSIGTAWPVSNMLTMPWYKKTFAFIMTTIYFVVVYGCIWWFLLREIDQMYQIGAYISMGFMNVVTATIIMSIIFSNNVRYAIYVMNRGFVTAYYHIAHFCDVYIKHPIVWTLTHIGNFFGRIFTWLGNRIRSGWVDFSNFRLFDQNLSQGDPGYIEFTPSVYEPYEVGKVESFNSKMNRRKEKARPFNYCNKFIMALETSKFVLKGRFREKFGKYPTMKQKMWINRLGYALNDNLDISSEDFSTFSLAREIVEFLQPFIPPKGLSLTDWNELKKQFELKIDEIDSRIKSIRNFRNMSIQQIHQHASKLTYVVHTTQTNYQTIV
jgi:hypothetical protein